MLQLGTHYFACFLKKFIVAPVGIDRSQTSSNSIVLSKEQRVNYG